MLSMDCERYLPTPFLSDNLKEKLALCPFPPKKDRYLDEFLFLETETSCFSSKTARKQLK